jgi:hypothetical protein
MQGIHAILLYQLQWHIPILGISILCNGQFTGTKY